ncbi:uncharacterized protein LOC118749989 [Rhagoletis pomonella]|uniref:uncharacterized protein LOC118749989 n=1 Tax=Rhagoletis pomonella TaxID=28610 RepID=UPI00177DE693|nr:uncharacterized protein LOC118749989 [Rhagoletis pomonella]
MISLSSDHLPIILSIDRPNDFVCSERRTYVNIKKANWDGFRDYVNTHIGALPTPPDARIAERKFRTVLNAAAARFIPAGRIPEIRPGFPTEAARLADVRDRTRRANPEDPSIKDLNAEIKRLVNNHKRNKWWEHLKSCNLQEGVSMLWSTVKSLSNPTKYNDHTAIKFGNEIHTDSKKCAREFCRQFIVHPARSITQRSILRKAHNIRATDTPPTFTPNEVQGAIHKAKASK